MEVLNEETVLARMKCRSVRGVLRPGTPRNVKVLKTENTEGVLMDTRFGLEGPGDAVEEIAGDIEVTSRCPGDRSQEFP